MRAPSVALGVFLAALAPSLCVVGYGIVASVGDERTIDSVAFAFLCSFYFFRTRAHSNTDTWLATGLLASLSQSARLAQYLSGCSYFRRSLGVPCILGALSEPPFRPTGVLDWRWLRLS